MPKTLTIVIILIITGMVLIGLGKQIKDALQVSQRLDQASDEVAKLQDRNNKLRAQLEDIQRYRFIEKIARDKLNMSKSNEVIVVIPEQALNQVLGVSKQIDEIKLPNWLTWLRLFVH